MALYNFVGPEFCTQTFTTQNKPTAGLDKKGRVRILKSGEQTETLDTNLKKVAFTLNQALPSVVAELGQMKATAEDSKRLIHFYENVCTVNALITEQGLKVEADFKKSLPFKIAHYALKILSLGTYNLKDSYKLQPIALNQITSAYNQKLTFIKQPIQTVHKWQGWIRSKFKPKVISSLMTSDKVNAQLNHIEQKIAQIKAKISEADSHPKKLTILTAQEAKDLKILDLFIRYRQALLKCQKDANPQDVADPFNYQLTSDDLIKLEDQKIFSLAELENLATFIDLNDFDDTHFPKLADRLAIYVSQESIEEASDFREKRDLHSALMELYLDYSSFLENCETESLWTDYDSIDPTKSLNELNQKQFAALKTLYNHLKAEKKRQETIKDLTDLQSLSLQSLKDTYKILADFREACGDKDLTLLLRTLNEQAFSTEEIIGDF